jgi:hypothetical protein
MRFSRWRKNDVWQRLAHALPGGAALQQVFTDSTIMRAHNMHQAIEKTGRKPLAAHVAD